MVLAAQVVNAGHTLLHAPLCRIANAKTITAFDEFNRAKNLLLTKTHHLFGEWFVVEPVTNGQLFIGFFAVGDASGLIDLSSCSLC